MIRITEVLLVSGSLRIKSTNSAVMRTACVVAPEYVETSLYEGLVALPHFNPDDDVEPRPAAVIDLRERIRAADAMMFSIPEYAGALPGSFKNLLDWSIGDDQAGSIYEKPVGWINASARGAASSHNQLRQVLGYAHASIIEAACIHLPVTANMIDADGLVAGSLARARIAEALTTLVDHAHRSGE